MSRPLSDVFISRKSPHRPMWTTLTCCYSMRGRISLKRSMRVNTSHRVLRSHRSEHKRVRPRLQHPADGRCCSCRLSGTSCSGRSPEGLLVQRGDSMSLSSLPFVSRLAGLSRSCRYLTGLFRRLTQQSHVQRRGMILRIHATLLKLLRHSMSIIS